MKETAAFERGEVKTENVMSLNHSRTIQRICSYLERYYHDYDILPELEIMLSGRIVKPDVSVYPNLYEDTGIPTLILWLNRLLLPLRCFPQASRWQILLI